MDDGSLGDLVDAVCLGGASAQLRSSSRSGGRDKGLYQQQTARHL